MGNKLLNQEEISALDILGAEMGILDLSAIFQRQVRILDIDKPELAEKNVSHTILAQTTFPGTTDICEEATLRGPVVQDPNVPSKRTLNFRLHVERAGTEDGNPSSINLLILWFKKAASEPTFKNTNVSLIFTPDDLAIIPESESPLIRKLVEMTFAKKGKLPHTLINANTALDIKYK